MTMCIPRSRDRGPVTSRVLTAALAVTLLAIRPALGHELISLVSVVITILFAGACVWVCAVAAGRARHPARVIVGRVCIEWP